MNINIRKEPSTIIMYECPTCGHTFKHAPRCPNCGQLVGECTSRHALLDILKSYLTMIERSGKEYPTVVLGDITASIKYVLKENGEI